MRSYSRLPTFSSLSIAHRMQSQRLLQLSIYCLTPHRLDIGFHRVQLSSVDTMDAWSSQGRQLLVYSSLSDSAAHIQKGSRYDPDSVVVRQHTLDLEGAYNCKADHLLQEIARARVEGRFSETERESARWVVRRSPRPHWPSWTPATAIAASPWARRHSMLMNIVIVALVNRCRRLRAPPLSFSNCVTTQGTLWISARSNLAIWMGSGVYNATHVYDSSSVNLSLSTESASSRQYSDRPAKTPADADEVRPSSSVASAAGNTTIRRSSSSGRLAQSAESDPLPDPCNPFTCRVKFDAYLLSDARTHRSTCADARSGART